MFSWLFNRKRGVEAQVPVVTATTAERIHEKYLNFRDLLSLNTECLEVIVGLQEDLTYIPPRRDLTEDRVAAIFEKGHGIVDALDKLTGARHQKLHDALTQQQDEVERYIAALQELVRPRLAAWTHEIGAEHVQEVGGKAATLGEVGRKLDLPVPNGYVLTTEAYLQFCGLPHWQKIRDAIHEVDPSDLDGIREVSEMLQEMVMDTPLPRAVEVAITDRARSLASHGQRLAVRSSAIGEGPEGGPRTLAGQFLSLINVPIEDVADAYKQVIASRFSERALAYRLSTGLLEVETPLAVLILPVIQAASSGIMYTRDPSDPKSNHLWITSTAGIGIDIASGKTAADLFVVARKRGHEIIDAHIAPKPDRLVLRPEGGLAREPQSDEFSGRPSLDDETIRTLATYGVRLEDHFKCPQDVEWAVDESGQIWILQTRPLAMVDPGHQRSRAKTRQEALVSGGRTIFPGQVAGPAYMIPDYHDLGHPPEGSIAFLTRSSPEIARIIPRVSGLVAEWGNVAGHAAALLREFKVPSVFLMEGAFDKIKTGDPVSLDSVQAAVYEGTLWDSRQVEAHETVALQTAASDPISRSILTLNLLDPSAHDFSQSGCKSTHDVLRYCHEKAVGAMFTVNDVELDHGKHTAKDLKTSLPLNLSILDLGEGLRPRDPESRDIEPDEIVSLPFKALWRGISHADVSWKRDMPASLSDIASVMASSLKPQEYVSRPLGRKSYVLVAEEYMNLNARLAYHFTLVDATITDMASKNYISFRFVGGGTTAFRKNLRAIFVAQILTHYGFIVDRRGDLVNAWFKKAPAPETFDMLDILGRLLACTSQLDMFMTSRKVMQWYVRQFLDGNYRFQRADSELPIPGNATSD